MVWARVDDGWWCHPKVLGLDLDARGLWVSALSWSCQQQTEAIPAAIVAMCGDDGTVAAKLVDAGLWDDLGDGRYAVHDWDDYQSERAKKAAAGKLGGQKSGETRRANADDEANDGASHEAEMGASDEAGPSLPGPTRPDQDLDSLPPDGGDGGESDADDPPPDSIDHDEQRFEEHFWPVYPPTNGRKPEKGKALTQWRKLTLEQQRRAVIGAKALARSDTVPKYAHRFLRKDTAGEFPFDDWQEEPRPGEWPDTACQQCGQTLQGHDDQLCRILADAS